MIKEFPASCGMRTLMNVSTTAPNRIVPSVRWTSPHPRKHLFEKRIIIIIIIIIIITIIIH
jgi:hypothetical protein